MKLTGKALAAFTDWLHKEMIIKGFEQLRFVRQFNSVPDSMQWGVYQDWADSLGYELYTHKENPVKTRQEARTAAIEKLNELINEIYDAGIGRKSVDLTGYLEDIKQALNIANVVGQSEQYHCELFDFGRCEKPCDKQCDSCYWMETKKQ